MPSAQDTSSDPPSFERYKELIDHFRKGGFIWTVEELETSYLLSYVPAWVSQDGWYEIDIKVKGRNLVSGAQGTGSNAGRDRDTDGVSGPFRADDRRGREEEKVDGCSQLRETSRHTRKKLPPITLPISSSE